MTDKEYDCDTCEKMSMACEECPGRYSRSIFGNEDLLSEENELES